MRKLSDIRSILLICDKELQEKSSPSFIVCQRWRQNGKTRTRITFNLDVVCWYLDLRYFLKVILFEGVSVEKI